MIYLKSLIICSLQSKKCVLFSTTSSADLLTQNRGGDYMLSGMWQSQEARILMLYFLLG